MDLNNPAHKGHSNYLISTEGRRAEAVFNPSEMLSESVVKELLEELRDYDEERCGFIDSDQVVFPVTNVHEVPRGNFYMDTEETRGILEFIYEDKKAEVLGIYHTHPNGYPWPSPRDIIGWPNPELGWRYFLVSRGQVTEWKLVTDD